MFNYNNCLILNCHIQSLFHAPTYVAQKQFHMKCSMCNDSQTKIELVALDKKNDMRCATTYTCVNTLCFWLGIDRTGFAHQLCLKYKNPKNNLSISHICILQRIRIPGRIGIWLGYLSLCEYTVWVIFANSIELNLYR